jgi:hypothetical protein
MLMRLNLEKWAASAANRGFCGARSMTALPLFFESAPETGPIFSAKC